MAIVGGLAAVAVASAGLTAGIMAATDGASSASAPRVGPEGFGAFGGGPGRGSVMAALHGIYVVSDGSGTYTTELSQTGTVSAVSSSAITVKSEDGFSKTYTVTGSTSVDNGSDQISSVVTGHTVRIVATTITDTNLAGGQNQGGQNEAGSSEGGLNPGGNGQPPGH